MKKNKKNLLIILFSLIFLFGLFTFIQGTHATVYIPDGTVTGLPDPPDRIEGVLKNILNWMLGIVGVIAVIGFVISGIQYILAAGSEKTIETAKRNMTYSILGVIVALSGYVIIKAVDAALRATSTTF